MAGAAGRRHQDQRRNAWHVLQADEGGWRAVDPGRRRGGRGPEEKQNLTEK